MMKNLPVMQETWVQSLGREDLLRREWQPTPVFLPGEVHEQRSLVKLLLKYSFHFVFQPFNYEML